MTSNYDHKSVSNVELLVLARLASEKGAKQDEITSAVARFATGATQSVPEALAALRRRSLVIASGARCKLTTAGRSTLCVALNVDESPTWTAVQHRCLSVLGLAKTPANKRPGLRTGTSKTGNSKSAGTRAQTLAVLRQRLQVTDASSLSKLCDVLLARALGFSGEVTLPNLHAHVLARSLGIDRALASTMSREELAIYGASQPTDGGNGKRPTQEALSFHGSETMTATWSTPPASAAAATAMLRATATTAERSQPEIGTPTSRTPPQSSPNVVHGDALLNLVREAIPRIGSDGRFGPEKVFVSALWHYIEGDGRLPDLSLERFKRWLVTANRDQLVDLVRADSQGDMDGRLLEESEIRDLGATFHFVIDRQISASRRGYHAR